MIEMCILNIFKNPLANLIKTGRRGTPDTYERLSSGDAEGRVRE